MVMLSPRLLVLGRRPRHDLHLLCCHLAIGLSRPVGEDVMIQQMLEAAGDAVILLGIVVDGIRGLQEEGQLGRVQCHDQNQCLQVCRREISFLLEIFAETSFFPWTTGVCASARAPTTGSPNATWASMASTT